MFGIFQTCETGGQLHSYTSPCEVGWLNGWLMAGKQASAVRIQSSAKFILNVYCQSVNSIEKSKRKNKEVGNGPL